MHRTLAIIAALAFATPAAAAPGSIQLCTSLSEVAELVMQVRQTGAPMHFVVNQLGASLDGSELEIALALAEAAYDEPLYSTAEYQQRAAYEFSSDVFRVCRDR